ncbi:hypothetical protein [Flavobacterium sp. 2]|uniref:hypothetical protein n=1 Tax=Flavobacterium sp. 2 TaxID=308053 RepID=UPI000C1A1043|nr:hypothetical protein [Flavobacterium sp. 2]PIF59042.1 hypothetical protein CLU99_4010 [Flavobacterium sp. 2]
MKKLFFSALVVLSTASFAINPKTKIDLPLKETQTKKETVEESKEDDGFTFCYEIGRTNVEVLPGFVESTVYYHCTYYEL